MLKLLQYCNYIIIVMQIKLMFLFVDYHKVSFFSLFSQFSRKWRKLKQILRLADTMLTLLVKLKTNCNEQFVGYH